MLALYKNGITSVVLRMKILDSTQAYPKGLTGLGNASSGLIVSTIANNESAATAYTVAASHVETISTLGTFAAPSASCCRFKEVDSTNHPGLYEVQIADARWAVSNARSVVVTVSGATNAVATDALIQLTNTGLEIDVNAAKLGGTTQTGRDVGASVLLSSGTGTGQVTIANGNIAANVVQTAGTTLVGAPGYIGPDWGNLTGKTATVALTGTTLSTAILSGIRKNVALANFEILMTDSTNHNPATGLTVAVTRSIDGGAFGAGTLGSVTEVSNGIYKFDFGAGDLNGTVVTLRATATGADDTFLTIHTDP